MRGEGPTPFRVRDRGQLHELEVRVRDRGQPRGLEVHVRDGGQPRGLEVRVRDEELILILVHL